MAVVANETGVIELDCLRSAWQGHDAV